MAKKSFFVLSAGVLFALSAGSSVFAKERYDWFWFLYERDPLSVYPSKTVTPFYYTAKTGNYRYTASLPPLFFFKYENSRSVSRNWLLGLFGDVDYTHQNGVKDYDLGVIPLFLYGRSADARDRYFFLWPAGGEIRGKLGFEYIRPWVFPGAVLWFLYPPSSWTMLPLYLAASVIPAYMSYGAGDYRAHAILWPFIQWGESPVRKEFRIIPFYAHNYKKDYFDNYSYGLIVNFNRTFYKNGRTLDTSMVFPFMSRRWMSDDSAGASSLFWPFFSWGFNKRQGDLEINFPWPLVVYQRSEHPYVRKTVIFPFYGSVKYERDETFFVTPLYFSLKRDNDTFSSDYYIAGIIGWYFTRDYKKGASPYYGNRWSYLKLWPVFRYESNDRGDVHFNMLSLLPFRDPAGYEKIYDPLWSIVEYHREKDVRRFGLLLRTYYQCWDDRSFRSRIPLLFSYESRDGNIRELLFLCSMFGYEKDKTGSYIRVVWVPIRTGEGGDPSEDGPETGAEETAAETVPQYAYMYDPGGVVLGSVNF
jgi:hypothetical protein